MNNKKIFFSIIFLLVLGAIGSVLLSSPGVPSSLGKYDTFAQCLKDKGAIFYGAFWCTHCETQKELFGSSASLLPYVECSTPNGTGQTKECEDKEIMGYPTWEFVDSTRLSGEIALSQLSEKTSCPLPIEETNTSDATQ